MLGWFFLPVLPFNSSWRKTFYSGVWCESSSFNNLRYRAFASFYISINWRCTIDPRQVGWIWPKTILPVPGYPGSLKPDKRDQKTALIKKITSDLSQKGKCLWNSFCPACFLAFLPQGKKATVSESFPLSWLLATNPFVFASSIAHTTCSGFHSFPSFAFL